VNVPEAESEAVFGAAEVTAVEPLGDATPAATGGVWRVSAGSTDAILKVVRHDPGGNERWPSSEDETDPYYWRREPLAYATGLLDRIAPLRAPRCLLCADRPDGSVALWLEDAGAGAHPAWTVKRLGEVARDLGRMQGRLAQPPPDEPWLSRGWFRAYLDLRTRWVEPYRDGPYADDVQVIWAQRDEILAAVDAVPQTLCHFDFYPSNVFGDDVTTTVIDWAYCGLGAVGLDAGNLVPDAIFDGFVAAEQGPELREAVWDAYTASLAETGLAFDDQALRYVFLAATALRYSWIPGTAFARGPEDALGGRWLEAFPLLVDWFREALPLRSPV
jgi:hypothetical protein